MADGQETPSRVQAPRYRQVAAELEARIAEGTYPVGAQMPTEHELREEFAISRHTVRDALRLLILQGLVKRRQGSGTEVIASAPPPVYTHSMRSVDELYEYASDTVLALAPMAKCAEAPAAAALGPDACDWLGFEGLRRARTGAAISFTRVWLPARFAGLEDEPGMREAKSPIYELVAQRYGETLREVEQEIAGEPLAPTAARALGRKAGDPSIRLIRRYLNGAGEPIIVSASWHPAETFSYRMRLQRSEAGRAD